MKFLLLKATAFALLQSQATPVHASEHGVVSEGTVRGVAAGAAHVAVDRMEKDPNFDAEQDMSMSKKEKKAARKAAREAGGDGSSSSAKASKEERSARKAERKAEKEAKKSARSGETPATEAPPALRAVAAGAARVAVDRMEEDPNFNAEQDMSMSRREKKAARKAAREAGGDGSSSSAKASKEERSARKAERKADKQARKSARSGETPATEAPPSIVE